jgi:hypothetical protein
MRLIAGIIFPFFAGADRPTMFFARPQPLPCESLVNTAMIRAEITTTIHDWIEELDRNPIALPRMITDNGDLRIYMNCILDRVDLPTDAFRRLLLLTRRDHQLTSDFAEEWFRPTGIPAERIIRWYFDHIYFNPLGHENVDVNRHFVLGIVITRPSTCNLQHWLVAELDRVLIPSGYPMDDFGLIPFR